MPELVKRDEIEAELATYLSLRFAEARAAADRGERISWGDFQSDVAEVTEAQLGVAYVLAFMAFSPQALQSATAIADSAGAAWASAHARGLARALAENMRRQLAAGGLPEQVFSATRIKVFAATEVTRAVTAAEQEARKVAATQQQDEPDATGDASGGQQQRVNRGIGREFGRPTIFDVADGLTPIWVTERDERVCPICGPLDRQRSEAWLERFPDGPPAHPNCRCHLEYEA